MKHLATFTALFLLIMTTGCASITEREGWYMDNTAGEKRSKMSTPVLAGTATDLTGIARGAAAPFACWFSEDIEGAELFLLPLYLIDLAPSLVADILYLPGDIDYWLFEREPK